MTTPCLRHTIASCCVDDEACSSEMQPHVKLRACHAGQWVDPCEEAGGDTAVVDHTHAKLGQAVLMTIRLIRATPMICMRKLANSTDRQDVHHHHLQLFKVVWFKLLSRIKDD
eukprot:4873142-Amphidinium_carterae.2